jgi:adenylate cyclase
MVQLATADGEISLSGQLSVDDFEGLETLRVAIDQQLSSDDGQLHLDCSAVEESDLSLLQLVLYAQSASIQQDKRFRFTPGESIAARIEESGLGWLFDPQIKDKPPVWGVKEDETLERARILLVDDSRTVRYQVRKTLEEAPGNPFQVEEANDGLEAMQRLISLPSTALPDVIVLDRNMPHMSGDEVALLIKSDDRLNKIQILMLTAQSSIDEMIKGLSHLQVDDYVSKPYHAGEFLARIKALLRIRQAERQQRYAFEQLKAARLELAETQAMATMTRLFQKFVPGQFLERMDNGEGLEQIKAGLAEGKEVTLLFSDIRSFTSLAEGRPPREIFSMLNEYFDVMQNSLDQHSGFIDKFIGDAIMAIFDGEDQALNAVKSATQMHNDLRELNELRKSRQEVPLEIGIGVHSGYSIIGTLGSHSRMDFTVIGDTVNLASRLEGLTKHYLCPLIISRDTLLMIPFEQRPPHRLVDMVQVKGKEQPVAIYEAIDASAEEVAAQKVSVLVAYERAISVYQEQAWSKAVDLFSQIVEQAPLDALSKIYLDRAVYFLENPPEENWNGVFRMSSK